MGNFFKNLTQLPKRTLSFVKSVVAEMKKTEFPTRAKSFRLAVIVLIGGVVTSLALFAIDALFVLGRTYLTQLNQ